MAKKKTINVADVLGLMDDEQTVNCVLYAYGVYYGSSMNDGMKTAKECKEQMNHSCLKAKVYKVTSSNSDDLLRTVIHAELVY